MHGICMEGRKGLDTLIPTPHRIRLGWSQEVTIQADNQSPNVLAENPMHHSRAEHIEIHCGKREGVHQLPTGRWLETV